jgi:hypothetical protein
MLTGFTNLNVQWVSNQPYVRRTTTVSADGARLVRTARVVQGMDYGVQYQYTPGQSVPIDLAAYARKQGLM